MVVMQPLWLRKTPAEVRPYGDKLVQGLRDAGFSRVRLETRTMKPVDAVGAIGERESA